MRKIWHMAYGIWHISCDIADNSSYLCEGLRSCKDTWIPEINFKKKFDSFSFLDIFQDQWNDKRFRARWSWRIKSWEWIAKKSVPKTMMTTKNGLMPKGAKKYFYKTSKTKSSSFIDLFPNTFRSKLFVPNTFRSFRSSQKFCKIHLCFYKQSIFDSLPKNCLSFSKTLPQKIV